MLFWIAGTHIMSTDEVGIVAAMLSISFFIVVLSRLGMGDGVLRFMPGSQDKNSLYNGVQLLSLFLSLVVGAIFLAGVNYFSPSLTILWHIDLLIPFIVYLVTLQIFNSQNFFLQSIRRADALFVQSLITGLRVPLILLVAAFASGVFGALVVLDISMILALAYGWLVLARSGFSLNLRCDWGEIKKILKFSLGSYTASLFILMPSSLLPILIINQLGPSSNAYFYIAYTVTMFLVMIPNGIGSSLFIEGSHDMPLKDIVLKSLRLIMLLMIPAAVLIFFFGNYPLLLFSKDYSVQSFQILQLMAVGTLFSAVTIVYIQIKKVQKQVGLINLLNSTTSVLLITLSYVFMSAFGLRGIGYAWLITNAFVFVIVLGLIVVHDRWIKIELSGKTSIRVVVR
jgi:O-antigen/teichoic acid export membrane protein